MAFRQTPYILLLILLTHTSRAEPVRLTIYDDGRSCPAGCDAHVVFHKSLNGTAFAHSPATPNPPYKKCVPNSPCTICFAAGSSQCLTVMYRGSCSRPGTFDFTPAFYQEFCSRPGIPELLAQKCDEFEQDSRELMGRINCIQYPDDELCGDIMNKARLKLEKDIPKYAECREKGEKAFNRGRKRSQQRIYDCAYEKYASGGPSKSGTTWHRLLPAACRPDTFVGSDGMDCCSGNPLIDGPLGSECLSFYPDRRVTYSRQKAGRALPEKTKTGMGGQRPPS